MGLGQGARKPGILRQLSKHRPPAHPASPFMGHLSVRFRCQPGCPLPLSQQSCGEPASSARFSPHRCALTLDSGTRPAPRSPVSAPGGCSLDK